MTEIREKLTIIAARLCTDIPLSTFEDDYYRIGIKEILIEHEAQDKKLKETALVLIDIIKALDKAEADTCDWNYLEEEEYYETDCGNCFYMLDECTLSDSEFKYCIYCGKRLTTKANE